jgi:anaerobic ribonucleoside-triphosphate reductase
MASLSKSEPITRSLRMETKEQKKTEIKVPCEVYSRIVGYLRPVQNWNEGKKQEYKDRKTFVVKTK